MLSADELNFLAAPILLCFISKNVEDWRRESDMPPIILHLGAFGKLYCSAVYLTATVAMLSLLALMFLSSTPLLVSIVLIFSGYAVGKICASLERKVMVVKVLLMNALSPGIMAAGLWWFGLSAWKA